MSSEWGLTLMKKKKKASKTALRFLHIYKNSPIKEFFFLNVQYNAIYGDELKNEELIRLGILKNLYWISSGKTHDRKERPKLIPFLDLIIGRVKLKKWNPPECDVKNFVDELKTSNDFDTLDFLKYLFRRNELYTEIYSGLIKEPVSKKGFIGVYSTPYSETKYAGVSFLIQKQLFALMGAYIAEEIQEKTRKIIKILEHEMEHGEQLSDKEIVRLFDVYIDEIEEYKTLMNVLPIESYSNDQDIKNKASIAIKQFDEPSLYNLLMDLQFDIETARRVGKYLIDNKMIDKFWRLPKKVPSSTPLNISSESLEELVCGECETNLSKKCNLSDLKNLESCPLCGSANIIKTKKK